MTPEQKAQAKLRKQIVKLKIEGRSSVYIRDTLNTNDTLVSKVWREYRQKNPEINPLPTRVKTRPSRVRYKPNYRCSAVSMGVVASSEEEAAQMFAQRLANYEPRSRGTIHRLQNLGDQRWETAVGAEEKPRIVKFKITAC
jgi:hypothetical protein